MELNRLKLDYLEEMGIEPWFPRVQLAHAAEVIVYDDALPEIATNKVAEILDARSSEAKVQPGVEPKDTQETQTQTNTPPSAASSSSAVETQPANVEQPVRFGLSLYVFGKLLCICSLPPSTKSMSPAAAKLLSNVVQACGYSGGTPDYHHSINWPFFSNPNASQGKTAASNYVDGVVEHLKESHGISTLLLFGGVFSKLKDLPADVDQVSGCRTVLVPSLFKMLESPDAKRATWKRLQPIRLSP